MRMTRAVADATTTPTSRRRRFRGALALGSILAVTIAGAAVSTAAATSADAATAGASSRAQIPWSKVGPGWTLASLATRNGALNTLYLVDSAGHRYADATLPGDTGPAEWSGDGRRALISVDGGTVKEIDLRTGKVHTITIKAPKGGDVQVLGYTKPHGLALLVDVERPQGDHLADQLERYGLDGMHQQSYPTSVKGAGAVYASAVETPDGAELIVPAAHGMVLLRNNGSTVRRLTTKQHCYPVKMWNATTVLAGCGEGALWTVPLSGAHPHRITAARGGSVYIGYADEWKFSRGTLGMSENGCGPASLITIKNGKGTPVTVPSPTGVAGRPAFIGHHGSLVEGLYLQHASCQPGRVALFDYNAATHRSTSLLGPGATVGTVTEATAWSSEVIGLD